MSAITSYRQLFSYSGWQFVFFAFVGRIPLAMSQIGTLLLVAQETGSYGIGGACAGALAVATAIGAPIAGSLADRIGQRPVVLTQSLCGALGMVAIVAATAADLNWLIIAMIAAITGLALPQVGPLARVRWRPIIAHAGHESADLVDSAFSYEGAADEASFVLGPALVGGAIAIVSPYFALLLAAVLLAVFGTLFGLHRSAALLGHHDGTTAKGRLWSAALVALCVGQLVIGMTFGSAQTGTSVLATLAGVPGVTGLLHALLGVGSVAAGILMASLPRRIGYVTRLRWFSFGLFALAMPLLLVSSLGTLAPVLLLLGLAVAPYMITIFTVAERITPRERTGAAMTMLAGATSLGYAVGSSLAGRLADWGGQSPAFAVTVAAGLLALTISLTCGKLLHAKLAAVRQPLGMSVLENSTTPTDLSDRPAS